MKPILLEPIRLDDLGDICTDLYTEHSSLCALRDLLQD